MEDGSFQVYGFARAASAALARTMIPSGLTRIKGPLLVDGSKVGNVASVQVVGHP